MRLWGATSSHVGNVRDVNQDRVYFRGSIAALADGMGGHQGGERAAELAIGEFRIVRSELSQAELVDVVEEANRQVHQQAVKPDLRGMGTTVVALGLHKDSTITVVNVGDSRAYWLRGDTLVQVTEDHSFVEDLVRQGRLSPEEAQLHPQRNILTRALGISDDVMVDRFELEPEVGDRFLLCSDGLFNEVDPDDITAILLDYEDPSEAADRLVAAALATPCRDNVTVAVVSVVEDDHPAVAGTELDHGIDLSPPEKITAQLPIVTKDVVKITDRPDGDGDERSGSGGVDTLVANDEKTATGPERRHAVTASGRPANGRVGDTATAVSAETANGTAAGMRMVRTTTTAERPEPVARGTVESKPTQPDTELDRRRRRWWPGVAVVLLAGLAVLGYVGAERYNDSLYHVETVDGELVIFHGRKGGLLWIEPVAKEETGRFVDDLTEASRATLAGWEHFSSLREAQFSVDNLDEEQEEIEGADGDQPPAASAGAGSTDNRQGGGDNADSQDG